MTSQDEEKNILDSVIYNYTSNMQAIEDENRILKQTAENLKKELERFRKTPLLVCEVMDIRGEQAVIKLQNGNEFLVEISEEAKGLMPGDMALAEQKNLTIVRKISISKKFNVEKFVIIEKPTVKWKDVGGLDEQAEEIKEVVELPLKKPELFRQVGIQPPKGILLYGEPGTGKTLLAKAVAASTNSTFIEVVGSELVQKFIGEGAKQVKEIFNLARSKAPAIVFIDEIDALAAKRIEIGTSGEREVQRTFMQLLAEIDGFKHLGNVKVVGCTNRKDILDPAILRPGRLDRLIKIPLPDKEGRLEIFRIHSKDMKTEKGMNIKTIVNKMEGFSGAEIRAACTEAGYYAIRENRTTATKEDFERGIIKVRQEEMSEGEDYMRMFG
ncbi:AAA family ATPase [Candidatus Woesearchaeota archaeon]|nr:AAA family ATPase [Candidatus Woesearchaeota archaeon]